MHYEYYTTKRKYTDKKNKGSDTGGHELSPDNLLTVTPRTSKKGGTGLKPPKINNWGC